MAARGPLEVADKEDPRFQMSRGSSCLVVEKTPPSPTVFMKLLPRSLSRCACA